VIEKFEENARSRRPARQPGCRCDRLCRARTGLSVAPTVWARPGVLPTLLAEAAGLNSPLASNLQQGINHTCSPAQRAEPGRAGAHLNPRSGPLPALQPGRLEALPV